MVLDLRDPKQREMVKAIMQRRPEYLYTVDSRMGDWQVMLQGSLVAMGRKAYANHKLLQLGVVDQYQYN
jgi:hypothetical protein